MHCRILSVAPSIPSQYSINFTLLQRGLETGAPHFLCVEDDVRFSRHLRENLAAWPPWVRDEIHLALLYHFGQRPLARFPAEHHIQADPAHCLGSQARIFSRAAAAHIIARIDHASPVHQDEQMARLASALGPLHIHIPSLVQHEGQASTWGGFYHRSLDFEENWRAG